DALVSAFDGDAPTILEVSGLGSATVIEIPSASDAPTILEIPSRGTFSRPLSSQPDPATSGWSGALRLPIGTVLGNRYEILQLLGEGGMGAVYKARDNELDRIIAIKVIRPELASNPEIRQRFKQELALARQVPDR